MGFGGVGRLLMAVMAWTVCKRSSLTIFLTQGCLVSRKLRISKTIATGKVSLMFVVFWGFQDSIEMNDEKTKSF